MMKVAPLFRPILKIVILTVTLVIFSDSIAAEPQIVVLDTSHIKRPNIPTSASPELRELFEVTRHIRRFEKALFRHTQQPSMSPKQKNRIWNVSSERTMTSMNHLTTALHRRFAKAPRSEQPALLHLQAWVSYQHSKMELETKLELSALNDDVPDDINFSTTLSALQTLIRDFPSYLDRTNAMIFYASVLWEHGDETQCLAVARQLVCPARIGNDNMYHSCTNPSLSPDQKNAVWSQLLGQVHFSNAELSLAASAFEQAVATGSKRPRYSQYMLGWTYYRQENYARAASMFITVLDTQHSPPTAFQQEATQYAAISLVALWRKSNQGKLLATAIQHFSDQLEAPYMHDIFIQLASLARDEELFADALEVETYIQRTWP